MSRLVRSGGYTFPSEAEAVSTAAIFGAAAQALKGIRLLEKASRNEDPCERLRLVRHAGWAFFDVEDAVRLALREIEAELIKATSTP